MYSLQLFSAINDEIILIDNSELTLMVPIVVTTFAVSYGVKTKIFDYVHDIDLSEIEGTIKKPWDYFK